MSTFAIESIRATRLDVPLRKAFGIAGGAQEVAGNVLVELTLTSGVRGWGEAAPLEPYDGISLERCRAALEAHAAALRMRVPHD